MNYPEATILLVENDQTDVLLIQRALRRARVINPMQAVWDGVEAVEYLEGTGQYADRDRFPLPVLVLLDLRMPRMSGHEVLKRVREQPRFSLLPVVVLTSSDQDPDIRQAFELGANAYLIKPGTFEEYVEIARQLDASWLLVKQTPAQDALV